jgi:hypothetical protein
LAAFTEQRVLARRITPQRVDPTGSTRVLDALGYRRPPRVRSGSSELQSAVKGVMGQMDRAEHPPPGWYADPGGQLGWRWWAGDRWSEHFAPVSMPYPAGSTTDKGVAASLQAKQARLDGFIAAAAWIWAAVGIVGVLVNWANVDYYRAVWHWWHAALHAGSIGGPAPAQPTRPLSSSLFSLVSLGLLVIEVFFFIWQYRAATVARSLRYSALHSPGWGVGCWFVPVVNLWMPYQAIRDCLPSGHSARRHILYTWLLLLLTSLLVPATLVALVGAPSVGVVLAVASMTAYFAVGLNAHRIVTAIAADHRDALAALNSTGSDSRWDPSTAQLGYEVQASTYPHYPGYHEGSAPPATNGLAIASLILSILWFFGLGSLLAVIFALVARSKIRASGGEEQGDGLAIAGLIIGICGLIGSVGFFLILNVTTSGIDQLHRQQIQADRQPPVTSHAGHVTVNALGESVNVGDTSGSGVTEVLVQDVAYPVAEGVGTFAIASVRVCAGTGGLPSAVSSNSFRLGISGAGTCTPDLIRSRVWGPEPAPMPICTLRSRLGPGRPMWPTTTIAG